MHDNEIFLIKVTLLQCVNQPPRLGHNLSGIHTMLIVYYYDLNRRVEPVKNKNI
jgi:hypothetical protein